MKAYMSVPGVRVLALGSVSLSRQARAAEFEASMLLAETEPDTRETLALGLNVTRQMHNRSAALAEALAAFCDDGQEARS